MVLWGELAEGGHGLGLEVALPSVLGLGDYLV